jgi:hypothetical protein
MNTKSTRHRAPRAALLLVLVALASAVWIAACCESISIKLGRISDFLVGVFDISIGGEVDIEGYLSVEFSGDLSAWSQIPSFDGTAVETDISAAVFSTAEVKYDVDYDAKKERIRVLRAEDGGAPLLFLGWHGDSYTQDGDVCYLGWVEQQQVNLAAGYCKQATGAMYCRMPTANEDALYCERCPEGSACVTCEHGTKLKKCLPPEPEGFGADLDIDIDIDIDMDIDLDMDVEPPAEGG